MQTMDDAGVDLGIALAQGREDPDHATAGDPDRWASALALADDYLLYREVSRGLDEVERERQHRLLLALSQLKVSPTLAVPTPAAAPHQGHATQRLFIGGGRRFGEGFTVARYRAAYHDLLDPEFGYGVDSRLIFFDIEARHFPGRDGTDLSRLTVLDIVSIYPWEPVLRKKSWHVTLGWESLEDRNCRHCGAMKLDAGFGGAVRGGTDGARLGRHTVALFADGVLQYGASLRHDHALGVGPKLQLLSRWSAGFKTDLSAHYRAYLAGDRYLDRRLSAAVAYQLGAGVALRAGWQWIDGRGGVGRLSSAAVHWYF